MLNNSQKGVSLIITFFIMTIVLAVVLSISTILYSELRIIRNMGNSVVAFFAADSGIEKFLYYDRKVIPTGAARGICNIYNICATAGCINCASTPLDTGGTGCTNCTNCHIDFTTIIDADEPKSYHVVADVSPGSPPSQGECGMSQGVAKSYGVYKDTARAINLDIETEVRTGLGPGIDASGTKFNPNGKEIKIYAIFSVPVTNPKAYIYKEDGTYLPPPLDLVGCSDSKGCHATWTGPAGDYYVTIGGIDANGFCGSVTVNPE